MKQLCTRRLIGFARLVVPALLLSGSAGCSLPYKVAVNDAGAPQYQRLDISYRVAGAHGALPQRGGVIGAAATAEQPQSNRSAALLQIEYPHPETPPGMARATLRFSRRPPSSAEASIVSKLQSKVSWLPGTRSPSSVSAGTGDEVWVLDFPRQQLDLMLVDLAHSGFFDDQQRHEGIARLSVRVDRGRTSKVWSAEPRLDDIALRVQREGWLASDGRGAAYRN